MWRKTPYDDEFEEKRIEIEIHNAYKRGFKAGLQAQTEKTCDTCKHYNEFCETPIIKGCKLYEQAQIDNKFKMRDATPEEQETVYNYIHSISKPTGINVFDFYEDEEKSCDNCKHHLKFMCKKWETCQDYSDWEQEELNFVQPKKSIPCTVKIQTQANGDSISRQMVKEQMIKYGFHAPDMTVTEFVEDLPSIKPQESNRDMKEIEEIINCDADAETKCKMITAILTAKPHYFEEQECNDINMFKENVLDAISRIGLLKSDTKEVQVVAECLRAVEALPPVKPQEPKWISVNEKLPDDGEDVLFCDLFGDIMLGYHPRDWKSTHFAESGSWELQKNVAAWMPLPEPYRTDREDGE